MALRVVCAAMAAVLMSFEVCAQRDARFEILKDDHIVIVGNTFAERMAMSGYFDALAYAAHPEYNLVIRNIPWSADEVGIQPREHSVPMMEDHLRTYEADVIIMCFGMSESFARSAGLGAFEKQLKKKIDDLRSQNWNSESPPRLVLVSPIAHEDLGPTMVTGDMLDDRNTTLAAYVEIMQRVSDEMSVRFVNLFDFAADIYESNPLFLTSNGIHPNERGCFHFAREMGNQLGWMSDGVISGTPAAANEVRRLCFDKHYHERLLYRATNTEYVWGTRHTPYGVVNFPPEMVQLARMIDARERAIRALATFSPVALFTIEPNGPAIWEQIPTSHDFPEDDWSPHPVEAKGQENSLGDVNILPTDEFVKSFTLPEGYSIDCFASEEDFIELENPLAMTFDARGRLWVLCTPTYPHLMPGEQPRCKLLILEDTDGDGRADKRTVFADTMYIPTGFAIDTDAVYIGQAPDLWKFTDTDGDDKADRREIVASGFGMPDSHHQISAFEWEPNGGFVFHEGVFTKSNVETPWGTKRTRDAATWRFDPRTGRVSVMSHASFANPWGHVYDDFGQSILADASGGENFAFSQVIMAYDYPAKPNRAARLLHRGRPTAGCELISSRHFPDDVQGSFLVNQSIGFHGTRWDRIHPDGSAWKPESMPQDLISSSDTNFRPVAMEIGPDGALYVADWCNPLIGHMQYSVRDPRRDHSHGRIWRVKYDANPLLTPPTIATKVPELLEQLRIPERNTRQHARRRLQRATPTDVFPALTKFIATLDSSDPIHDRLILEALWIHQAQGRVDMNLLERVTALDEPLARAGGVRVLRHWLQQEEVGPSDALPILERAVGDDDMRVRLEGVVACGFIPSVEGAAVAGIAAELPMDDGLRVALASTISHLAKYGEPKSDVVRRIRLQSAPVDELLALALDDVVANVVLLRTDVPLPVRTAALLFLAGDDGGAQAQELLRQVRDSQRPAYAAESIAPLVMNAEPNDLALANWSQLDAPEPARALGIAALIRADPENAALCKDDSHIAIKVMEILAGGDVPDSLIDQLRTAVDEGVVDPSRAISQIARHARDDDDVITWFGSRIDFARDRTFDRFGRSHEVAMAALRELNNGNSMSGDGDRYRLDPVDPEVFERGRDVYFDAIAGCVRCHRADGLGEEGFPPLDRSPWVLGDPTRAAAIVIHGLYGRIDFRDGRSYESVMEPLGDNLDDEQIAAVLSFVRQSWGNYAQGVTIEEVREARDIETNGALLSIDNVARRYPLSQDQIMPVALASDSSSQDTGGQTRLVLIISLGVVVFILVIIVKMRAKRG